MKFGVLVTDGLSAEEYAEIAKKLGQAGLKCLEIARTPVIETATGKVVTEFMEAVCEAPWTQYLLFKMVNGLEETIEKASGWHILSSKV